MCYHNHEQNIALAREWIDAFRKSIDRKTIPFPPGAREGLICLLQAFIEDALIGHAKIEELDKLLHGDEHA